MFKLIVLYSFVELNKFCETNITVTLACFSQKQDLYDSLYNEGIVHKLINGYPSYDEISKLTTPHKKEGSILILDDGLNAVTEDVSKLFFQLFIEKEIFPSTYFRKKCCFT